MFKSRSALAGFLLLILCAVISGCSSVAGAPLADAPAAGEGQVDPLRVTLSAPYSTMSWDARDRDRERFELPLLYLHQEREATVTAERTLELVIAGLPARTEIQIEAISHHEDVTTGQPHSVTTWFRLPDQRCIADDPCRIQWVLDGSHMPSDFYHLLLRDAEGNPMWANPDATRPDFVALDTWDVPLGAYTARITYGTLFPFSRGPLDHENRLAPDAVTAFIEEEFATIIRETWQTQVEEWGFAQPLRPDWDGDNVIQVFVTPHPLALFDGTGTYSLLVDGQGNPYPERRIWWLSDAMVFQRYDTLANGYRVVFAHEFFHLLQWNVLLSTPQPAHFWWCFLEGQAKLAQSIQYPELELDTAHVATRDSSYVGSAADFLKQRLNGSYQDLEADTAYKYATALYWRFLYEQVGSLDIVRAALEATVAGYDAGIVGAIGPVMDRALTQVEGPYQSFEESLVAFARANYALRLEHGRCTNPALGACGGLYFDPHGIYVEPALAAELAFDGAPLVVRGEIPASYGMDFIEIRLSPAVRGQPLTLAVEPEFEGVRLNVQMWRLAGEPTKPRAVTPGPEMVPQGSEGNGVHAYVIPGLDTAAYDRLALIITRLDPDEAGDATGGYQISLR
jgi:hypothetical protein